MNIDEKKGLPPVILWMEAEKTNLVELMNFMPGAHYSSMPANFGNLAYRVEL